jgi:hypothetical protein
MNNAISIDTILNMLKMLSNDNKKWIADHLYADIATESKPTEIAFPKLPRNFKVSDKTLKQTAGNLPKGFDVEKELNMMWEEFAK